MFAGGGGSSLGYRLAGGYVALISEFVAEARRTYATNFPETLIDPRDIRDVTADPEGPASFISSSGPEARRPGRARRLTAMLRVLRCRQRQFGDQTVLKAYSDTAQRGIAGLIFEFMTVAVAVRPKVLITENVPTLAGRYVDILDRACHRLRFPEGDSGPRAYYAGHAVLAADDFGVPQIGGACSSWPSARTWRRPWASTSDQGVAVAFPQPTEPGHTVRQALAGLVPGRT